MDFAVCIGFCETKSSKISSWIKNIRNKASYIACSMVADTMKKMKASTRKGVSVAAVLHGCSGNTFK